jgi:hypothetical protein
MPEPRAASRSAVDTVDLNDPTKALRQLGARAHQLRAATRAADHFNARGTAADTNTGSWLMSTALALSAEVASDLDALARTLKEKAADAALRQTVAALRVRAHQLHAAAVAADHFLDQETREDQDTGGWLVTTATSLAQKLASEIDDGAAPARRPAVNAADMEPHDAALARRVAAATTPLRGAA